MLDVFAEVSPDSGDSGCCCALLVSATVLYIGYILVFPINKIYLPVHIMKLASPIAP